MTCKLLLFGSRDFSKTVAELAKDCEYEVVGTIDDYYRGPSILGTLDAVACTHPPDRYKIAFAIGYNNLPARMSAWTRARNYGYAAVTLVHPRAYVARSATVGDGVLIMAGAIVDARAKIGDASVLWPGVNVSHDTEIGANSFLSPGVIVCGHVAIGDSTFVGAGAVVTDHQRVPSGSFLRAHALYHQLDSNASSSESRS